MGGKRVLFHGPKDLAGELNFIKGLVEQGKFKPVIDRKYSLEKIAEAYLRGIGSKTRYCDHSMAV